MTSTQVTISYLQEISPAPEVVYVGAPGSKFTEFLEEEVGSKAFAVDPETGEGTYLDQEELEARCGSGTAAAPTAESGNLCLFAKIEEEIEPAEWIIPLFFPGTPMEGWISPAPEAGAVAAFAITGVVVESNGGFANGSWAVSRE